MKKEKRGFELVELLIVVAVIGLFAAIIVPTLNKIREINKTKEAVRITKTQEEIDLDDHGIKVIKIGNCQYLYYQYDSSVTHKGDCSNPIHPYNKEREEK